MPGFFDKLSKAAQQTAAAAQQTAAEGKIRLDIRTLNGRLDDAAQSLGHLMFRQHKGETIPEEEYVKILDQMVQIEAERHEKEAELEARSAAPAPAPAPVYAPAPAPATASGSVAAAESTTPAAARFCNNCGRGLSAGAKFCPDCGTPVGS